MELLVGSAKGRGLRYGSQEQVASVVGTEKATLAKGHAGCLMQDIVIYVWKLCMVREALLHMREADYLKPMRGTVASV